MPIYEYECKKCGVVDIMQKLSEGAKRKCPECGSLGLKKLISAPAFQLKGTGWYETDFKNNANKDADQKDGAKTSDSDNTDAKSESKSDSSSESKSDTKSESKSESKSDSKSESKSETKSDSKKGSKGKAA